MGVIDHLLADGAVQAAIRAQREAERRWVLADDKDPDPQLWCAVMTVVAFARAGGNCELVRNLAGAAERAERRARGHLTVVRD
ncbi:hypothetical protein MKL09_26760 [Methylobacterium sp. J-048]|uniref:hypothetical protein n=1 Tax=Methylobacterium sp. J-048 TaxID=2836635 RepID=UPI001FBB667D|nr:hypothetical protein [Methylobacterium sp. J-048]MCJ2060119.1 hypothetical protein [Methylobacterium sp. J-048]